MKKVLIFIPAIFLLAACGKPFPNEILKGVITRQSVELHVSASAQGFVVIDETFEGARGAKVATSELIDAGESVVVIPIRAGAGNTYTATLYSDDNDDGILDPTDPVATDDNNSEVVVPFEIPATDAVAPAAAPATAPEAAPATTAPAPSAGNSADSLTLGDNSGGNLTVTNATLSKPGFVGIYQSMGGAPTFMAGRSGLLKTGSNDNVTVPFKSVPGKKYIAMLRSDDNGDGTLDDNTDSPINGADGQTVMTEFTAK